MFVPSFGLDYERGYLSCYDHYPSVVIALKYTFTCTGTYFFFTYWKKKTNETFLCYMFFICLRLKIKEIAWFCMVAIFKFLVYFWKLIIYSFMCVYAHNRIFPCRPKRCASITHENMCCNFPMYKFLSEQ